MAEATTSGLSEWEKEAAAWVEAGDPGPEAEEEADRPPNPVPTDEPRPAGRDEDTGSPAPSPLPEPEPEPPVQLSSQPEVDPEGVGQAMQQTSSAFLLPYHRAIVASLIPGAGEEEEVPDEDEENALVVLAPGLGMRRVISTILRIYDAPTNLVLLVGASAEEEASISEELLTLGVRPGGMEIVDQAKGESKRRQIYLRGGLVSATSQILVADMLRKVLPTELVTGIVVLHAERVSKGSTEAYIVRLYRDANQEGFLKAFSEAPQALASRGLQHVASLLRVRRVEIWPRFHKLVQRSLAAKQADVIELYQDVSPRMLRIQTAILECLEATVGELRRSSSGDPDTFSVDNALFQSFDRVARTQLSGAGHKLGPKTRQLLADLGTLRNLLTYLLEYDAIYYLAYLESVITANQPKAQGAIQKQSPWLLMDAANIIISEARARVFEGRIHAPPKPGSAPRPDTPKRPCPPPPGETWPSWVPDGISPTLEEQPKWKLLQDVMREIEQDIQTREADPYGWTNNTILIMTASARSTMQVNTLLSTLHHRAGLALYPEAEAEAWAGTAEEEAEAYSEEHPGRIMMWRRFKEYLIWKSDLGALGRNSKPTPAPAVVPVLRGNGSSDLPPGPLAGAGGARPISDALRVKYTSGQAPPNKRRRVRGGAAAVSVSADPASHGEMVAKEADELQDFSKRVIDLVDADLGSDEEEEEEEGGQGSAPGLGLSTEALNDDTFNAYFGLLSMENLVIVRTYKNEDDDKLLQEIKPRYIILFDPSVGFIRQIEVYRKMHPSLQVRLYFMLYAESSEEQRYLSSIRKEKDAFERLIKDKAGMVVPLRAGRGREAEQDSQLLRTISTRLGGQLVATRSAQRVVVDRRELRSALPSMLTEAGMEVVPVWLTVGDYVLAPEICIERKSLSDLVHSFADGRLYTQVEIMSIHYRNPMLLIEYDEERDFSLQALLDAGGGQRPITGPAASERAGPNDLDVQAKLVLLTITFKRLRILWSSSPTATAQIFRDLKENREEPDVGHVAAVGVDKDSSGRGGEQLVEQAFNRLPHVLLRAMPGINHHNAEHVMKEVRNVAELCGLSREEVRELIGNEPGTELHRFLHRDARTEGARY